MKLWMPFVVLVLLLFLGIRQIIAENGKESSGRDLTKAMERQFTLHVMVYEIAKNGEREILARPCLRLVDGKDSDLQVGSQICLPDSTPGESLFCGLTLRANVRGIQSDKVRVDLAFEKKESQSEGGADMTVWGLSVRAVRTLKVKEVARLTLGDETSGNVCRYVDLKVEEIGKGQAAP